MYLDYIKHNTDYYEEYHDWDKKDKDDRPFLYFKTNYVLDTIYVSTKNKEIAKKLNNSTKVCTICDKTLPIDEFGKDSFSTDGKDSRCKSCSYLRTVRKTNPILNTGYTIKEFVAYIQANTDYNKRYKIWRKSNINNLKPILVYKDDDRSKIENVYFTNRQEILDKKQSKTEQECRVCHRTLPMEMFSNSGSSMSGKGTICRKCVWDYEHTEIGYVNKTYASQRSNSKKRGHKPPTYTLEEFRKWVWEQPNSQKMYDTWKASGFKTELKPSADRFDESKGYSFDNIQLITWKENIEKNAANLRHPMEIENVKTGEVVKYKSILEASKKLGIRDNILGHRIVSGKVYDGYTYRKI